MSILFSVARLVHPTERMRRIVTGLAVFFSLICLIFIAIKLWWYVRDLSWLKQTAFYTLPSPWLPYSIYIYELCSEYARRSSDVELKLHLADCISDTILIILPVRLLWSMRLPTKQRRMIIAIFSSSIIVTMVSVLRAVSQIMCLSSLVGLATDFEVWLHQRVHRVQVLRDTPRQLSPPSPVTCS